mmetsp:Transcript_56391/g.119871  ORF Transcript_56391/g.119871 Transcript_56391/m.119871 type:complete len:282 (+) Transcript_56391:580-1425(+)
MTFPSSSSTWIVPDTAGSPNISSSESSSSTEPGRLNPLFKFCSPPFSLSPILVTTANPFSNSSQLTLPSLFESKNSRKVVISNAGGFPSYTSARRASISSRSKYPLPSVSILWNAARYSASVVPSPSMFMSDFSASTYSALRNMYPVIISWKHRLPSFSLEAWTIVSTPMAGLERLPRRELTAPVMAATTWGSASRTNRPMASLGLSLVAVRKRAVEGSVLFPLSMSDTLERRVESAPPQSRGDVFSSRDCRAIAVAREVDVEGEMTVSSFSLNSLGAVWA